MGKRKNYTEWIRLVATPQDKALLEAIKKANGDEGFSTTVRGLIREEAARRGLQPQTATQPKRQEQAA